MGVAHGDGHGVRSQGNSDEVDMVGHQAKAEDFELCLGGISSEEAQVSGTVLVVEEDVAAEIAALGDVVRAAHGYHALELCHREYSGGK